MSKRPEGVPDDIWAIADAGNDYYRVKVAVALAIMAERERSGGASAIYFDGKLIIAHPEMPPHIWDGERMTRVDPT